ncbi:hypothetical protein [Ralstonia phage RP13]|nr:hypothetical protein [Ralstonia phage RP13]
MSNATSSMKDEVQKTSTDVLMCDDCGAKCCHHPKDRFNTLEYPNAIMLVPAEHQGKKCVDLDDNNRCKRYDTRYLECRTYPYMIDREGVMYVATSCPSYKRVVELLQQGDQSTIDYLLVKYNILINMPDHARELHDNRVKNYISTVRLNLSSFESAVKVSY